MLNKTSSTFLAELLLHAKEIFEKQSARNAFEQLHNRHSHLLESLPDVLYELDSNGRFAYLSPNVANLLDYTPEELIGTPYATVIAPDHMDQARHRFNDRRTGTRASRNTIIELTPKVRPQQPHPVHIKAEVSAKGLYNSQRQYLGTRGVLRDISHQRHQEETIRRLTQRLQQATQLISAGQRLASLSKELESHQSHVFIQSQELLTAIQTLQLTEHVEDVDQSAKHTSREEKSITTATSQSDGHHQTINSIIESVLTAMSPAMTDTSRIERVYAKNLPPFTGQHETITRLMHMLLLQVLHYMTLTPTHRRMRVSTSVISTDDHALTHITSPSPSTRPLTIEILIEETDETIVTNEPLPLQMGDLVQAYTLLKQLGGRLDVHAPLSGPLSIAIRIPVEAAPPDTAPSETLQFSPTHPPTITGTARGDNPLSASSLPDRRSSPRIFVYYPTQITIGENTHTGILTSLGQGGMDLLIDAMPPSIENQQAYVVLQIDDTGVELEAVSVNRSSALNGFKSEPGYSRFALRLSQPINDHNQTLLSTILKKAQAHTHSLTVEILLTSETLPALTSHVAEDATRERDHREAVRVRVRLPVHVQIVSSHPLPQHSAGIITNLSRGGACLHLDQFPGKPGDHITIRFAIPGPLSQGQSQTRQTRDIMLSASIVWTADGHTVDVGLTSEFPTSHCLVGICFFAPNDSDEEEINDILRQHIISSMNVERVPDQSSLVHAAWECRTDRQQVIAVTDTHLRHRTSSNSPIVIIVPGYGRTQTDYLPLACYLAAAHFRVLRYDHTNHLGLSDGQIEDTSLSHMQTALQALLLFSRTTWPTVDITLIAEDVAARVVLKTMAMSCTADHLFLVNPTLDIRAALFSTYGRDVIADFQRGTRRGLTNLWGLNVDFDAFLSDTIVAEYGDWQATAADRTAVSPTPIILTTPEWFGPALQRGAWSGTHGAFSTSPVIALPSPIAGQSADEDHRQGKTFHMLAQRISTNTGEPLPPDLMHTSLQYSLAHRRLTEKERIRICHHVSNAHRKTLHTAYLTQLPQLQQMTGYGVIPTEFYQHLLPITPGMTVLDMGCEQSAFSKMLVTNHTYTARYRSWTTDNPVHYIGLSHSHHALTTSQQQLDTFLNQLFSSVSSAAPAPQAVKTTWMVNDWDTSLPFESHSIDRLLLQWSLSFTRSPLQCLREAVRVLRHDGIIIATSFRPHTDLTVPVRRTMHTMQQDVFSPPAHDLLLFLGRLHEAIHHGLIHSYEPDGLASLCTQAGGRPIQILPIVDNQLLLAVIQKH